MQSIFQKKWLLAKIILAASILGSQAFAKDKIFVARKGNKNFKVVLDELQKELTDYDFIDYVLGNDEDYTKFEKKVRSSDAKLMVLMDNASVTLGKQFFINNKKSSVKAGVALMALNLPAAIDGNQHLAGIAFESPAYTMVTSFKQVTTKPVKNVLVLYRKSVFENLIQESKEQLALEKIKLHAVDVEAGGVEETLKKYLFEEINKGSYDVVWVLLDSALLKAEYFKGIWIKASTKTKIPFISGTELFAMPKLDFCTFVITPELKDMAGQAAQIIDSILRDGLKPSDIGNKGIEKVESVTKILNKNKAKSIGLSIDESALTTVRILK